jgi:hypothetical protein
VQICDRSAVVREQLCGHNASPAAREHAIRKETFPMRSVPGRYNEDQLPLRDILETAVRRVEGWVRRPTACEDVSPGTEERPLLTQFESCSSEIKNLVAEAGDSSRTWKKVNVPRLKPLPSNGY